MMMMYTPHVKRLQISIEEDLDDLLMVEAARRRTSKAALIREYVRERLGRGAPKADPISALIGDIDDVAGDIDAMVYDS
ncbi:MAG: CopG family transcriptional regulator [Actinomycetota bacterium]